MTFYYSDLGICAGLCYHMLYMLRDSVDRRRCGDDRPAVLDRIRKKDSGSSSGIDGKDKSKCRSSRTKNPSLNENQPASLSKELGKKKSSKIDVSQGLVGPGLLIDKLVACMDDPFHDIRSPVCPCILISP